MYFIGKNDEILASIGNTHQNHSEGKENRYNRKYTEFGLLVVLLFFGVCVSSPVCMCFDISFSLKKNNMGDRLSELKPIASICEKNEVFNK